MRLRDNLDDNGILCDLYTFLTDPSKAWYIYSLSHICRKIGLAETTLRIVCEKYDDLSIYRVRDIDYIRVN